MKKITLKIEGMTCSACSNGLEKYLNRQDGIVDVFVNLVLGEATIKHEDNISISTLEKYIEEAGFKSLGPSTNFNPIKKSKKERSILILLAIALLILMYLSMGHMLGIKIVINKHNFPNIYVSILFLLTLPFLIFSKDIFINGFKNLKNKMPNMDTLVSISVIASLLLSIFDMIKIYLNAKSATDSLYFESVAIILFFVKLGRYIDKNNKNKTTKAIEELVQITPEKALLSVNDTEKKVTIDEIKVDDILICKPGMKIAVDGIIIKGSTNVDESFITGESKYVKKKEGDHVVAGSINYDGLIHYQAKKIGKDSTISEIVHLVMDAINTKAPISRVADKISGYFIPILFIIALITLISHILLGYTFTYAINRFVTVLVVACPCALGLATPLAIVVATGTCAKNGILIKTSEILENASKIDTIIFDKTGTLTKGKLEISEIITNHDQEEILKIVSSIEKHSTHPISHAFFRYSKEKNIKLLEVYDIKNLDGVGITAKIDKEKYYLGNNKLFKKLNINNPYEIEEQKLTKLGNSIIYVIKNKEVLSIIGVKDKIREESKEVISKLKKMNKQIIMLTGDNKQVANLIAKEIGITEVIAEVIPKEKRNIINSLKEQGKKVMMIGDGINDAPSLALAGIGVSFKNATSIATSSADVILLKNNLTSILDLVIISKETLKIIYQNLFWAFLYNTTMILIATNLLKGSGITINPMIASITMTLSSLTVVFNALRLRKIKLERKI